MVTLSKNVIMVSLLFLGLSATSQNMVLLKDVNGIPWRVDSYVNVKGSPFMTNDWVEGYLRLNKSTQLIKDVKLKFNTYTNELIVLKSSAALVVTNVSEFGWIDNTQDSLLFRVISMNGYKPGTIFQVLFVGENKLYKHTLTTLMTTSAGYSDARKIDEFVTDNKLLIVNTSGTFEIKNKKDLKKALAGYGEKLDKLLENRSISVKNEDAIVLLLKEIQEK